MTKLSSELGSDLSKTFKLLHDLSLAHWAKSIIKSSFYDKINHILAPNLGAKNVISLQLFAVKTELLSQFGAKSFILPQSWRQKSNCNTNFGGKIWILLQFGA